MERAYREGLQDLDRIRNDVRDKPEMSREVAQMIREMKKLDPSRFQGNPELVDELITQVLPGLEQIELRLRRELEGDHGFHAGGIRNGLAGFRARCLSLLARRDPGPPWL